MSLTPRSPREPEVKSIQEWIIREATPDDSVELFGLIQKLAIYEKLEHEVVGNPSLLRAALEGDQELSAPVASALIAEYISEDGRTKKSIGFALYYPTFSTFLCLPGIHLEDLFVIPDYRGQGIGTALLSRLARLVVSRGWGRLEWDVLD